MMNLACICLSDLYFESDAPAPCLDLRDLEGTACYCDAQAESELRSSLASLPLRAARLIDTGDYHYLSLFFLERICEPFRLVLLDNHPDDQAVAFGDILSCGSWVLRAKESLPLMKEVVWIDGSGCEHLWKREPESDCPLPCYLSVDLDVMSIEFARTDWEQGTLGLSELLGRIDSLENLIGADICGGITRSKGGHDEDFSLNEAAQNAILKILEKKFAD